MFCNYCGQSLPENSQFCSKCGATLLPPLTAASSSEAAAPMQGTPEEPASSGKAIASLITGILGVLCLLPSAIAAIILGHISRSEIRRSQGRLKGDGMALAGLVMGYIGISMVPFMIIAAIAIPNLLRSRIAANEASAVGALRTINTAQQTYAAMYPQAGYSCELRRLGGSSAQTAGENAARLIEDQLASGIKNGYRVELTCDESAAPIANFRVTARPITPSQTGIRSFCSDQTGVIRYSSSSVEECTSDSTPLQ